MKIADFDNSTRALVHCARAFVKFEDRRPVLLKKLTAAVEAFDEVHSCEMAVNVINAIFPRRKAKKQ